MRPEKEEQQTVTNSMFKTSAVEEADLKMESCNLKRRFPLLENQPEPKKVKLTNREKHVFVSKW